MIKATKFSEMGLTNFYNEGFGWICRPCEHDLGPTSTGESSRLLREGEAESKRPELSSRALAKWEDPSQRVLVCPRCGISEAIEKF